MAEIISGKVVSEKLRLEFKDSISKFILESGHTPGLAVVLVGDNPASQVYVRNKHKACLEVGINSYEINLPTETTEEKLLSVIDELNSDSRVDGILVQLPLPKHIDEERVINRINPEKDVDAFSPSNVGRIMIGNYTFLPCTPAGVMELLKHYNIAIEGKNCVVIGRSNIVGKPMAMLLLEKNGTVTVCHSRTQNIVEICRSADIIVVAVGRAGFLTADMVKPGAVVIDVGINRGDDGKLCGDVAFDEVEKVASYITPVPGGVGPMTITMLLKNTLSAAKNQMTKIY
ncbi:MAG: bifunctional methylenetetrahydrofolate dehydrogenase/methenyltetrahydrofolate cyclohydrolase FolD [Clostridia bacterium]|nr:bifunctional methylenetetrahydrofolate dehydrogenase/methenyltetrahydrofolate cyclohydrolase FolD [Clostridia bacterium]